MQFLGLGRLGARGSVWMVLYWTLIHMISFATTFGILVRKRSLSPMFAPHNFNAIFTYFQTLTS
jgi:hypothetical protein